MQTLYGFGTSACWWAQACGEEKTQDEIAELLYGDSGLKLNIYRYNIGGGYDEAGLKPPGAERKASLFTTGRARFPSGISTGIKTPLR